jgi:thiamine biosynthesis lipoprotein ApbE
MICRERLVVAPTASYSLCEIIMIWFDVQIAFYKQSVEAAVVGKQRLAAAGLAVKRPDDYFCESVKSDAHMNRVKDRLILEEKKIDAFEKRKQREVSRKYDKQVAALRKQENSSRVKAEISEVSKLRRNNSDTPQAKRQKLNEVLGDSDKPEKSKKRLVMVSTAL